MYYIVVQYLVIYFLVYNKNIRFDFDDELKIEDR